jgi:hypothetical protein
MAAFAAKNVHSWWKEHQEQQQQEEEVRELGGHAEGAEEDDQQELPLLRHREKLQLQDGPQEQQYSATPVSIAVGGGTSVS